jgi:hypothetical protein
MASTHSTIHPPLPTHTHRTALADGVDPPPSTPHTAHVVGVGIREAHSLGPEPRGGSQSTLHSMICMVPDNNTHLLGSMSILRTHRLFGREQGVPGRPQRHTPRRFVREARAYPPPSPSGSPSGPRLCVWIYCREPVLAPQNLSSAQERSLRGGIESARVGDGGSLTRALANTVAAQASISAGSQHCARCALARLACVPP